MYERGARQNRNDEANKPSSPVVHFGADKPLKLDAGVKLSPFQVAYQTYGELNAESVQRRADLPCADRRPACRQRKPDHRQARLVGGADRPRQNHRHRQVFRHLPQRARLVPGLHRPGVDQPGKTGKAYGIDLPVITIRDMVRAQAMLVDHLGIDQLFCVIGGSLGRHAGAGMGVELSDRVFCRAADGHRHAPFGAEHRLLRGRPSGGDGRSRLARRPLSRFGVRTRKGPVGGAHDRPHHLSVGDALHRKFGRNLQDRAALTFSFDADFQVESYLRHQGMTFVDRFDANSYLYLSRAMDYFDLAADHGGVLADAFKGSKTRFCVVSFTSDWHFPTEESRALVHALNASGASVSFVEIDTDKGHDAFLLDEPELFSAIGGFVASAARARGLAAMNAAMRP
jgi:homoserine O-acetyltransferase